MAAKTAVGSRAAGGDRLAGLGAGPLGVVAAEHLDVAAQAGPLHRPAVALAARRRAGAAAAVDVHDAPVAERGEVVDREARPDSLVGHHAVDPVGAHAPPDDDHRDGRGHRGDGA